MQAEEHYSAALRLDAGLTSAHNNRALARLRLARWADAEADCCAVLAREPGNVKALLRRAAARLAIFRLFNTSAGKPGNGVLRNQSDRSETLPNHRP